MDESGDYVLSVATREEAVAGEAAEIAVADVVTFAAVAEIGGYCSCCAAVVAHLVVAVFDAVAAAV